jgi:hypothetical protein
MNLTFKRKKPLKEHSTKGIRISSGIQYSLKETHKLWSYKAKPIFNQIHNLTVVKHWKGA